MTLKIYRHLSTRHSEHGDWHYGWTNGLAEPCTPSFVHIDSHVFSVLTHKVLMAVPSQLFTGFQCRELGVWKGFGEIREAMAEKAAARHVYV